MSQSALLPASPYPAPRPLSSGLAPYPPHTPPTPLSSGLAPSATSPRAPSAPSTGGPTLARPGVTPGPRHGSPAGPSTPSPEQTPRRWRRAPRRWSSSHCCRARMSSPRATRCGWRLRGRTGDTTRRGCRTRWRDPTRGRGEGARGGPRREVARRPALGWTCCRDPRTRLAWHCRAHEGTQQRRAHGGGSSFFSAIDVRSVPFFPVPAWRLPQDARDR